MLGIVFCAETAVISVWPEFVLELGGCIHTSDCGLPEDVLSVRVDVEVQTYTTRVFQRLNLGDKATVLRSISGSLALVGFGARVGTRTIGKLPLVGPITIDVSTDAATPTDGLTVLAPETIGCL